MNPFKGTMMPVDSPEELFNRQETLNELESHILNRKQTVILGVEGCGKTSVLSSFFNREYRMKKLEDNILITSVTEFPSDLDSDAIYNHFTGMVINAVRLLIQCGRKAEMDAILEQCEGIRKTSESAESYFEGVVSYIHTDCGYRVVFVVDNFETFTSSATVTMKHHENMRKLLKHSQYIVATNYDLTEDSLPDDVSGSLYLMNFAGNEVELGGWSEAETREFLEEKLKGNKIAFSDAAMRRVYELSGGIPFLIGVTADYIYDHIKGGQTVDTFSVQELYNDKKVQTLLEHWCKMLTPTQAQSLKHLLADACYNQADESALRCLRQRGLLANEVTVDMFGNVREKDNRYVFCCELFKMFCESEGSLEAAMEQNPLKKTKQTTNNAEQCDEILKALGILFATYTHQTKEYEEHERKSKRLTGKILEEEKSKAADADKAADEAYKQCLKKLEELRQLNAKKAVDFCNRHNVGLWLTAIKES